MAGGRLLLPAARPALSPGHYLVDGPAGRLAGGPILRVYVHLLGPHEAPGRWHDVLTTLNDAGVTYRAKIVSTPGGYPRRDAMVVYLGPGNWAAAGLVRDAVAGRPGTGGECSVFAHRLAPGVAAAWNPSDPRPGFRGLSFGEHRARVTAAALLGATSPANGAAAGLATGAAAGLANGTAAGLARRLDECFAAASIDPARPARNRDSPAVPELGL
jgi:hypothetical protein